MSTVPAFENQVQAPVFLETTESILATDMTSEWIKIHHNGLLKDAEKDLISSYEETKDLGGRLELLQTTELPKLVKQILNFHEVTVVQYALAIVDQALTAKPELSNLFADSNQFLSLLKREECVADRYICWKTCRILSHLFSNVLDEAKAEVDIKSFISLTLRSMILSHPEPVLYSYQQLLRKSGLRSVFLETDGIQRMKGVLESPTITVQATYQVIFIFWLLSFEKDNVAKLNDVIPPVVTVARQSQKEKVIRISIALLRNLATEGHNIERMIESKLHKQLDVWNAKRWGDEDIVSDLEWLTQKTREKIDEMSSFERYRAEVLSGELEWTPVHFSETFWRENISRFADNSFELIRILTQLLSSPDSKNTTKAVACYDIGEFVRLHPAGRKVINELGTKTKVMGILYETSTDPEIQKQALLCTRKMMISNWEMVSVK